MRYLFSILFVVLVSGYSIAQCGGSEFCNGNTGLYSNDDATNIAYDNMGSSFHSTFIKEPNGEWKTWGADMRNNGNDALSPISINTTNYPLLTGTIYKIAVGSSATSSQLIVLTSDGLFIGGTEGVVVDNQITTSQVFNRITVGGETDGLPAGVNADQIKMLFATTGTLIITTCLGEVFVLSQNANVRGNGGIGSSIQWSKVMIDDINPLTNIIVARGNSFTGFALKSDGTLWTWGNFTSLGDGTAALSRSFATQMTLPSGIPGIKMIQATYRSYFVLGTNKKVYALGHNSNGQLGDRTSIERTIWVNAKNPDDSLITDAAWISANEHDNNYSSVAIIRLGGKLYTAGSNSSSMIGRISGSLNYLDFPNGISSTDIITQVEAGGHSTAVIKLGSPRYGYVGHRIDGSMGDGSSSNETQQSFDFITPPIVSVCGTICSQPTLTINSSTICQGTDAVFTISGTSGDIVTYTLNAGSPQTAVIGANGSVAVTVPNATVDQNINLTFILGGTGDCSNFLSMPASITISNNVTPSFTQVTPTCSGATLNPLPTTSNNGITGTWSPPINTSQTTTYTFTPTIQGSCIANATMTIGVVSSTVPTFTQVPAICEGTAVNPLPSISNNGIAGTWAPTFNNQQTTTYAFTPNGGSCINLVNMTVAVNPKPTPTFNQVAPICEGTTLPNLPTISNNGITGFWSPAIDNTVTTIYAFTPTSDLCALIIPMTIVVNPKVPAIFSANETICYGDVAFSLPTVSTNGVVGTWSPVFSNTQTTAYIFTPDPQECAFTASTEVTVFDDFDFQFTKYCQNGNLMLQIFPSQGSFDINSAQFNWQIDNVNVGNNAIFDVTTYLKNTVATEVLPISFAITVTNADGCPKTKSIPVESIYCGIQKGISPNNDGLNEFFDLRFLNVKHLSIYNRYGTKVYSKDGYKEEWHGQADNGNILPNATYYYVIDFENESSKTGWVYINNEN
jgi:gliding motility-associated-like protein